MGSDELVGFKRSPNLAEQRGMEAAKSFAPISLKNKNFASVALPCLGLNLTALGLSPILLTMV